MRVTTKSLPTAATLLLLACVPLAAAQQDRPQATPGPVEQTRQGDQPPEPARERAGTTATQQDRINVTEREREQDTAREQQMRREVDEAVDAIRGYTIERREEAMTNARAGLRELDREMRDLQARGGEQGKRMSEAARANMARTMDELRERRTQLAEWTGSLRHGGADAWDEVRQGFVRSYHEFESAMQRARAELDRDAPPPEEPSSSERQREQER